MKNIIIDSTYFKSSSENSIPEPIVINLPDYNNVPANEIFHRKQEKIVIEKRKTRFRRSL